MKVLFAFSCLLAIMGCGPKARQGTPVRYEYSYSGTMMYPILWYEVSRDDNGLMTVAFSKDHSNDISVIKAPDDALKHIGELINEHKLYKLDPSYMPAMDILDGYGWHMFVEYEDDYLSSGGTNAWPKKELDQGITCINSYLDSLFKAAVPQDSLGVAHHHDWGD